MTVDKTSLTPPKADPALIQQEVKTDQPSTFPLPETQELNMQQQQPQQQQQDQPMSFESFMQLHPKNANSKLSQLAEVIGLQDRSVLIRAFNETRVGNYEFNVAAAIDWILNLQTQPQTTKQPFSDFGRAESPIHKTGRVPSSIVQATTYASVASSAPGPPPNSPNSTLKPLVDLTEASPNTTDNVDSDLEKAIKLSLEEARSSSGFGAGGISQEEQDVSRALEASLMESQLGVGNRKRVDNWVDPLNPHERERDGVWPVGLKNVGQTCWFSAVIQSLFYIPAFCSLVLNYRPLTAFAADDEKAKVSASQFDEKQQKINEFMQELRKLFALLIASKRKYVDPSKAVDILRGFIGCAGNGILGQQNLNNFGVGIPAINENNQQDVSEFMHIMLEWVEEAFKNPDAVMGPLKSGKCPETEMMDEGSNDQSEKENSEEKERKVNNDSNCPDNNPMSKLFYGKVLIEGAIQGEPFSKIEAFGQWPLNVNSFTHIHDSLENSTAHELFVSTNGGDTEDSGQERWFVQLPPVLFLELSRFHYNTERMVAEKIHKRLDFPDTIFMDRYMHKNKDVTRTKREQVKILKEKRRILKERLEKFTRFGSGQEEPPADTGSISTTRLSLPEILKLTLSYAMSKPAPLPQIPESKSIFAVASSVMMQVDSPCHSPKMTPASSLSNLATTSSLPLQQDDCPMEVEDDLQASSNVDHDAKISGCELTQLSTEVTSSSNDVQHSASTEQTSSTDASKAMSDPMSAVPVEPLTIFLVDSMMVIPDPTPRTISEVEMNVLQNCLSRWKSEVEEDIKQLEASILQVEKEIAEMYDTVEDLCRFQYRLHAVMVHEGSIDYGHYWAYVRDHKREVWLKFNDNTVSEVTWEELSKESFGGHSNTSAYSLVYIDASKPELLIEVDGVVRKEGEEHMEESGPRVDIFLKHLPDDLIDFVIGDNDLFRQEIVNWDKEQLEKSSMASTMPVTSSTSENDNPSKQIRVEPMGISDLNNDVQVVQEKLTHTNTHARLSIELSHRVIKLHESAILEKGAAAAVESSVFKTAHHFWAHIKKNPENSNQAVLTVGPIAGKDLCASDVRLESFVAYLLKNGFAPQARVVELAALEQFAHPGLESNDATIAKFRKTAETFLNQKRQQYPDDALALRDWHQLYHWFRRSAHCFVNGLEAFHDHKFSRALDLFTEASIYTIKLNEAKPGGGAMKGLRMDILVKYLCLALPEVNYELIKNFQLGEGLADIVGTVQQLVGPAVAILQARLNSGQSQSAGLTLETIREEWCALVADMKSDSSTAITEILTVLLETEAPQQMTVKVSKNGEFVNQNADLKLSLKYQEWVSKMQQELPNQMTLHN